MSYAERIDGLDSIPTMTPRVHRFALGTRGVRALALTALAVGYADLIRGGITLSAMLLAIGYLVLTPLALLGD